MSHILFLYNRKSGRQTSQHLLNVVVPLFEQEGASVTARPIDFCHNPFAGVAGVGAEAAEQVVKVDYVVVAGGDGTIGYVVDKMLECGLDLPLGIIPAGTANDFATMLHLPDNPRKAAQHILRSSVRRVDCGEVNGCRFVNVFSFGLFTTTSQHTADTRKRLFGRLAYISEGVRELRNRRAMPLTIKSDDQTLSAEVITALVFNGCTAGRFPLARDAKPDDGVLDGVFFLKRPLPHLVVDVLRYLCGGRSSSVKHIQSRHFEITSPLSNIATDTDGEQGPSFPLRVECLVGGLRIKG